MKKEISKVNKASEDTLADKMTGLKRIIPEVFSEDKIDWEKMKLALDGEIDNRPEKYGLSWAGKNEAFRAIRIPATGTLVPQENVGTGRDLSNWDKTQNIFIEGDNLEALKLLQKHYREKIKMIYIDPPYNTGKDFIYKDNFTEGLSDYYERTGQAKDGVKLTSNLESNGRYHSDWLTMMYPRLFMARNLLREDGVIFISIDDNEVHNLRMIMDEIFGEENFIGQIVWQKKTGASDAVTISTITEYIIVYSKNIELSENIFERNKESFDPDRYSLSDEFKNERGCYYIDNLDRGGLQYSESLNYPIVCPDGSVTYPNGRTEFINDGWIWKWSKKKVEWARKNNFIEFRKSKTKKSGWAVCYKNYLFVDNEGNKIERSAPVKNLITDILNANAAADMKNIFDGNIFHYSKPIELIERIISFVKLNNNDIILDFFAGSGTTAHAVMDLNAEDGGNRKWICVQIPEEVDEKSEAKKAGFNTIAEIARERIRRAAEKILQEKKSDLGRDRSRPVPTTANATMKDLDLGFKSFKLSKSNYRQWNIITDKDDEKKLKAQMKLFVEKPLVDNYGEKSVVYEILTKEGFDLNANVSHSVIPAKTGIRKLEIWTITDGERKAVITFAKKLTKDQVDSLGLSENNTFICLDSALDDTTKVNLMRNYNIKVI